ncbi:ABC transporter permease subunit [Agrobacterium vitis]|uniref:carbohydrate ABC transporter permease n=1 Tax=Rhizobium/Agrobacterium group TaxID=227290 RepID=UPI0012E85190|nr:MULTISPECIES: carbohydrate ABC transporter permease [Rhizobium/Agrobacterium group]MCF1494366.1 carbohydrate ABC transporter permease [Allorhizobium ampelinum]MVA45872.1 ABC transporter permease subunit [Agrobacterium vitis]
MRKSMLSWLLLSPLVAINLFPFVVMLLTAIKPREEVFAYPPRWLPSRVAFENFGEMWQATNFGPALVNSLSIGLATTVATLLFAVPAAYATTRFSFTGKVLFDRFLLVVQMISPIVLIIGLFRLMVFLGLADTHAALVILYSGFNLTFAIWMLASYFETIPRDVEEAAWMEGSSKLRAAIQIFLPLALPAIAVTGIFTFINAWNDFALALTVLRSPENNTVTLQVVNLVAGRYTKEWHLIMAAAFVATIPVTIAFIWCQKYLVRGLAGGAVK